MKRVLIFSTAYFPHVGGAEVAIREITDRTQDAYEYHLVCARFERSLPKTERIGAVTVRRVGFGIRVLDKILAPFLTALFALRQPRYDLYWAMMVTYGSGGAYLANCIRFWKRTPVVLTLQEGDPPAYLRSKWFGLVGVSWRLALSQSKTVTVISSYLGNLAKEFGYTDQPILISNGVDTQRFMHTGSFEERECVRKSMGVGTNDTVLVTTSRLVKKNACDVVIQSLSFMPDSVFFVIYGDGPDKEELVALARREGVSERVLFLGHVPYEELPSALHAADIFIRPSRSEGMGNSFIEAMAAGLPVVATQEGGIADFLYDAVRNPERPPTGWAVDVDQPEQIADAVARIQQDMEATQKTVANARKLVEEKYEWKFVAAQMKSVFETACIKL